MISNAVEDSQLYGVSGGGERGANQTKELSRVTASEIKDLLEVELKNTKLIK